MSALGEIAMVFRRFAGPGLDLSSPAVGEAGWGSDGRYVQGAATDTAFTGAFQPVTQKDLETLREGLRSEDLVKIYTETTLETVNQHEGTEPDRVFVGAVEYVVVRSQFWGPESQIPHSKLLAIRQTEQPTAGIGITGAPDNLLQAIREVYQLGQGLTNAQIIVAGEFGPRPPVPYLDVRCESYDIRDQTQDDLTSWEESGGGAVDEVIYGSRSAFVSVQGYGDLAPAWMTQAILTQGRSAVLAALVARGVTVTGTSPTLNISAVVDSRSEKRWEHTWELVYDVATPALEIPACEIIRVDVAFESTTGAPDLTIPLTQPIEPLC